MAHPKNAKSQSGLLIGPLKVKEFPVHNIFVFHPAIVQPFVLIKGEFYY